jgi:hypothetical protein
MTRRKSKRALEAALDDLDDDAENLLADGWSFLDPEEAPDREPDRVIDGFAFYTEEADE